MGEGVLTMEWGGEVVPFGDAILSHLLVPSLGVVLSYVE